MPKDPETWRFAVYYRKFNALTIFLSYPIPRIDDLFHNIRDTAYMTTLSLTNGYFQIKVRDSDILKTAFIILS